MADAAELPGSEAGRGVAGGLGYGERRRRLSVRAKNEEGEGKMARGEGGVSTGLVHVSRARGWKEGGVDTTKQEVAARAASTRPPAYWQEVEDGAVAGLGQLQCWARWLYRR